MFGSTLYASFWPCFVVRVFENSNFHLIRPRDVLIDKLGRFLNIEKKNYIKKLVNLTSQKIYIDFGGRIWPMEISSQSVQLLKLRNQWNKSSLQVVTFVTLHLKLQKWSGKHVWTRIIQAWVFSRWLLLERLNSTVHPCHFFRIERPSPLTKKKCRTVSTPPLEEDVMTTENHVHIELPRSPHFSNEKFEGNPNDIHSRWKNHKRDEREYPIQWFKSWQRK